MHWLQKLLLVVVVVVMQVVFHHPSKPLMLLLARRGDPGTDHLIHHRHGNGRWLLKDHRSDGGSAVRKLDLAAVQPAALHDARQALPAAGALAQGNRDSRRNGSARSTQDLREHARRGAARAADPVSC